MFKEGKSIAVHPIRISYKVIAVQGSDDVKLTTTETVTVQEAQDHCILRAGFSVSSRNFKKAVHRNRIKRLLRETYRKQKSALLEALEIKGIYGSVSIFIIYTGKELPGYDFVDEKMKPALKKLADQLR